MRTLLTIVVCVFAMSQMAPAETLYLNPAQAEALEAQTVTVSHDGSQIDPVQAGCQSCQQPGSLGQYPGGCCENDASCCAALWENYCRDKKPCWTPGSPRRDACHSGFGIPVPHIPKMHLPSLPSFCHHKFLHKTNSCDDSLACDCDQTIAAMEHEVMQGATDDVLPGSGNVDDAGNVQPMPEPLDEARRTSLPFGLKMPSLPKPSNPFKPFPTARMQFPFSR